MNTILNCFQIKFLESFDIKKLRQIKNAYLIKILLYFIINNTILMGSNIDMIYQHRWEDQIKKMIEDKNYQKAKVEAKKLIEKYPNSSEGYYLLGLIYKDIDLEDSMAYYKKSLQLYPNDYRGYVRIAQIYNKKSNKYESLKYADLAINHNPTEAFDFLVLSNILCQYGETDKAISLLRKLIDKNPNYILYYYLLAVYYLEKEDFERATELNNYVLKNNSSSNNLIDLSNIIIKRRNNIED